MMTRGEKIVVTEGDRWRRQRKKRERDDEEAEKNERQKRQAPSRRRECRLALAEPLLLQFPDFINRFNVKGGVFLLVDSQVCLPGKREIRWSITKSCRSGKATTSASGVDCRGKRSDKVTAKS